MQLPWKSINVPHWAKITQCFVPHSWKTWSLIGWWGGCYIRTEWKTFSFTWENQLYGQVWRVKKQRSGESEDTAVWGSDLDGTREHTRSYKLCAHAVVVLASRWVAARIPYQTLQAWITGGGIWTLHVMVCEWGRAAEASLFGLACLIAQRWYTEDAYSRMEKKTKKPETS